jgi:hypothetical protein
MPDEAFDAPTLPLMWSLAPQKQWFTTTAMPGRALKPLKEYSQSHRVTF